MKKRRRKVRPSSSTSSRGFPERAEPPRARFWPFWLAPLLALIANRSVTGFEFVGDARFLILENRFAHSLEYLSATLAHDYFWSSSGNIIPYYRPFTRLSWLFEWQAFRDWAGGYALVNVSWHASAALGLAWLGVTLGLSRAVAVGVAVVFALHPIAVEPVSLIMARSDVVATSAAIWAVASFCVLRRRTSPGLWLLHCVATALALGSKEAALALPLVLVSWSLASGDFARPLALSRLRPLLPSVLLGASYFALRKLLLERQAEGLSATTLAFDPLRIVACFGLYLRETFPFGVRSAIRELPIAEAKSVGCVSLTLLVLGFFAASFVAAVRRRETSLVALHAWFGLALLPVLLPKDIAVVTEAAKYPLADRWLYFALGPALLVWATWLDRGLGTLSEPRRSRVLRLGGAVLGGWAAVMLARSNADRAELGSDLALLDNEDRVFYQGIPEEYRTAWDHCRHDERMLARASLSRQPAKILELAPAALARCSAPELDLYYLEALVALGRFEEAESVARRLAAEPPRDRRAHGRVAALVGTTLVARGRTAEARPFVESAVRLGALPCSSFVAMTEAARKAGRLVEAAAHAETAFECGGQKDPSLLVAAATFLGQAGERERARSLLARTRGLTLSSDQADQARALESELGTSPR